MTTTIQIVIETLLRRLGARGTGKGFWSMVRGVELALEDRTRLTQVSKLLYPLIAADCGMDPRNMVRDMRTLVKLCWEQGDRALLEQVAGRRLVGCPSVGEFMDYMCGYLRRQGHGLNETR